MRAHVYRCFLGRIAVLRGHYLRSFAFRFIELCAPDLTERAVRAGMETGAA